MAKIKRDPNSTQLYFRCPGCKHLHAFNDNETDVRLINPEYPEKVPVWGFNNDYERPTITGSYLLWSYLKNPETGKWDIETDRCHSLIENGMIQFLSDSYHELVGQTIELPELE